MKRPTIRMTRWPYGEKAWIALWEKIEAELTAQTKGWPHGVSVYLMGWYWGLEDGVCLRVNRKRERASWELSAEWSFGYPPVFEWSTLKKEEYLRPKGAPLMDCPLPPPMPPMDFA